MLYVKIQQATEVVPGPAQAPKMESFAAAINSFKALEICGVLAKLPDNFSIDVATPHFQARDVSSSTKKFLDK